MLSARYVYGAPVAVVVVVGVGVGVDPFLLRDSTYVLLDFVSRVSCTGTFCTPPRVVGKAQVTRHEDGLVRGVVHEPMNV